MVDLYKEAKTRLKSKGKRADSQLDASDIRYLIVTAMVDGILTNKELTEMKNVKRYKFDNMEDDAVHIFMKFMNGVEGKKDAIKEDHVGILDMAKNMYTHRVNNSKNVWFDQDDIRVLLVMSIGDGRLTGSKLNDLLAARDYLVNITHPGAKQLFADFVQSYHKRLYPNGVPSKTSGIKQQKTQSNSANYMNKRQCGVCSGTGSITCNSCYGMGGRSETRVDYDYEGNANYRNEWINCYSCNGGYSSCYSCGGKGEVFA